ncbi:MAG TPA: phage holin family protein, partial [Planctomycetota bacterium]|nr:phage holin family protein [Planctomycetota bacterium]
VVGLAAIWPLLLVGVVFPKVATFIVSFVPAVSKAPTGAVRGVWIGLAAIAPVVVGLAVASKAPPGAPPESFPKRVLRGFPITLGLALAFLIMFVTIPVLRAISAVRGRKDEHVPLVTEAGAYGEVAGRIDATLARHGIEARRGQPSWWMAAPTRVLQKLGGKAFRGFIPDEFAFWRGPDLELALYPSDVLIRGATGRTAWTHGLLAETLARGPGLQTTNADAQAVERQIRRVWAVLDENPEAHARSPALLARLREISADTAKLQVEYDEWQVVYRQLAQLGRALDGEPQLLESVGVPQEAKAMKREPAKDPRTAAAEARPLAEAPTRELMAELASETTRLVKKEIELARAEVHADLAAEAKAAKGLGVAGVFGLVVLNLLFVAAALSWAQRGFAAWVCVLVAAGGAAVVAAVTGLAGWTSRVRVPLERARRTLEEDRQWMKERFA